MQWLSLMFVRTRVCLSHCIAILFGIRQQQPSSASYQAMWVCSISISIERISLHENALSQWSSSFAERLIIGNHDHLSCPRETITSFQQTHIASRPSENKTQFTVNCCILKVLCRLSSDVDCALQLFAEWYYRKCDESIFSSKYSSSNSQMAARSPDDVARPCPAVRLECKSGPAGIIMTSKLPVTPRSSLPITSIRFPKSLWA